MNCHLHLHLYIHWILWTTNHHFKKSQRVFNSTLHTYNIILSLILSYLAMAAMLRSMTTRRSPFAYEQLTDETPLIEIDHPKLVRTKTVPAGKHVFSSPSSKKVSSELHNNFPAAPAAKSQAKQVHRASKVHPLFSLFDGRKKSRKVTARPEFSRYLEYVKEGGYGGIRDMASKTNISVLWFVKCVLFLFA